MIEPNSGFNGGDQPIGSEPGIAVAQTTGRHVVVFAEDDTDPASVLRSVAGLSSLASSREYGTAGMDVAEAERADAAFFDELGVAVVSADPDQLRALQTSPEAHGRVLAVTPEYVHHVLTVGPDYLAGYRQGVIDLTEHGNGGGHGATTGTRAPALAGPSVAFADTDAATWGLQATRVVSSPRSGKGIRVAVLDTGLDLAHPDFAGRNVQSKSFVPGVTSAQDGHGHGSHCVGTSCGPKNPEGVRRYGVAHEADIYVGKVLSDKGSGTDEGILAGIDWAITNDVHIVSMSLGADVPNQHPPYNQVGRRALNRGTLIIAAAGNNAARPANPGFVGIPANSPAIIAVGALDSGLGTASFSARTLPQRGGQVDLAGPGVQVFSSWPMPTRYHTISGTSMATPHVSGIAALWAEATEHRALRLWGTLVKESRRLAEPSLDVGSGLVVAPQ